MKIPNKVIIGGNEWTIKKLPKERGGWFNGDTCVINIGTKNYTQDEIENTFLHEIVECILAQRLLRYKLPFLSDDSGHYIFCFKHLDLENWIRDLRLALKDCLK